MSKNHIASSTASTAILSSTANTASSTTSSLSNSANSKPSVLLALLPEDPTELVHRKLLELFPLRPALRIGRVTSNKSSATRSNGFFESKVLSRQHAEVSASEDGYVMLTDVGSSNGTFINGERMSPDNEFSRPIALKNNDKIDFGVNIYSDDEEKILYKKVTVVARILNISADYATRRRFIESFEQSTTMAGFSATSDGMGSSKNVSTIAFLEQLKAVSDSNKVLKLKIVGLKTELKNDKYIRENPHVITKLVDNLTELHSAQKSTKFNVNNIKDSIKDLRENERNTVQNEVQKIVQDQKAFESEISILENDLRPYLALSRNSASSKKSNTAASAIRKSSPGNSSITKDSHSGSSGVSFLIYFSFFMAVVACVIFYVAGSQELRESCVKYFKNSFNIDLEPFLDMVLAYGSHFSDHAKEIYSKIKNTVSPTPIAAAD